VNAEQASKKADVQADPTGISGKADMAGCKSEDYAQLLHRGSGGGMYTKESVRNTGSLTARSAMTNRTPARDRPGALRWRRGASRA